MHLVKLTRIAFAIAVGIAIHGCSFSGHRESPLPKTGPKMIDIYRQHLKDENGSRVGEFNPRSRSYDETGETSQARRPSGADANTRFARLPNPDLEMYVYPHLAKGRYPVPGYTTVFPMFESVQYALPGETPPSPVGRNLQEESRALGAGALASLESLDSDWLRAGLDFRHDMLSKCAKRITLEELQGRIARAQTNNDDSELARRYESLKLDGRQYAGMRASLDCSPK